MPWTARPGTYSTWAPGPDAGRWPCRSAGSRPPRSTCPLAPSRYAAGAECGASTYETSNQVHLAYHDRNRQLGRLPGQLTLRVRYQNRASAWFDWLCASTDEVTALAAAARWRTSFAYTQACYAVILTRY
jgi:hypothetical protein